MPRTPSRKIPAPRSRPNSGNGGSGSTPLSHDGDFISPSIVQGTSSSTNSNKESTTPAYPESTILLKRSFLDAKINLSDMRPVDAQVLEKIKNLEISLKQYQNAIRPLRTKIGTSQNEIKLERAAHDSAMMAWNEKLSALTRSVEALEEEETRQQAKKQELLESIQILGEELENKDEELVRIQHEFEQSREDRERLLQEREESEREALEEVREVKAKLLQELEEILVLQQEFDEASRGVMDTCGYNEGEALKARLQELDETILELEQAIIESKNSSQVEEKNADELVLIFEKVKRDHDANEILEEYLTINQVAAEAEEKASKEEFDLMVGKEELGELEIKLQSLRMQLDRQLQSR
ncbi:hypothetical protein BGZ83_004046 [Gryganskiella cystojenkinii]|nr:hypothetical protein BGZ83_004046 [Gryganskiella cystojenkinii]